MASDGGKLRVALAQINPTVGDIEGNAAQDHARRSRGARRERAQLVVLPGAGGPGLPARGPAAEAALPGRQHASAGGDRRVAFADIVALVGYAEARRVRPQRARGARRRRGQGARYTKMLLPNYGVFDERRYFEPGPSPALIEVGGRIVGLTICEDIWFPGPPAAAEALAGAGLIVNASASPYHRGKGTSARARDRRGARAAEVGAAFALCNTVGGQDELVFDGHSVVVNERGETVARAAPSSPSSCSCATSSCPPSGQRAPPRGGPRGDGRAGPRPPRGARAGASRVRAALPEPLARGGRDLRGAEARAARLRARRTGSSTSCSRSRAGSTPRSWP